MTSFRSARPGYMRAQSSQAWDMRKCRSRSLWFNRAGQRSPLATSFPSGNAVHILPIFTNESFLARWTSGPTRKGDIRRPYALVAWSVILDRIGLITPAPCQILDWGQTMELSQCSRKNKVCLSRNPGGNCYIIANLQILKAHIVETVSWPLDNGRQDQ